MNSQRHRAGSGRIDLTMVHTLKALFDTGQVSKAAELLGVSQPSVSQNLKRLRDYFGDPMFVRSGNRLHPTPRAMALEATVARVARDVDLISRQPVAFDPATTTRDFIVSFTDIAEFMVLPDLSAQVRKAAPNCTVSSVRPPINLLQQALERGEIDLAAGTLFGTDVSLRQQRLGEYAFVCLCSSGGRWAKRAVSLGDYRDAPHVVVPRASDAVDPILQRLELQGVRRHVALSVGNHFAACGAVEQADLLMTVPQHVGVHLAKMFRLRVHPLPLDLGTVATRIIWHERFHHDPGHLWLRQKVERTYRAVTPQQTARAQK